MTIQVRCPNPQCGATSSVSEESIGRRVRCSRCQQRFTLSPENSRAAQTANASTTGGDSSRADRNTRGNHPREISRFQILGRLGAGAFGTVYKAYDPRLEREVALKVPQPGTLEGPKQIERFLREGKASARLRHPHIVAVFEAGSDGEHHYIASEFIPGRTLASAIADNRCAPRQAAEYARQLGEALAYAHELGIVHRDVKPANVMLDERGQLHLMDFGLAHRLDASIKITRAGAVLGTPAFMAPEQARGQSGDPLPASDQYSLGVILYEMLCGRLPFEGPPDLVLFNAIHTAPPTPRSVEPGVPLDLETICLKALSKSPQDRYETCQALADDLRRWLENEPIRARRLNPIERFMRWCQRQPVVAALTGAITLALVLIAVLSLLSALRENKLRARAESEEKKAREEARRAENQLYFANIHLARQAWLDHRLDRTRTLLDYHWPRPDRHDPRGWEWYYLQRLARFEEWSVMNDPLSHPDAPPLVTMRGPWQVCFSPNGRWLAAGHDATVKLFEADSGRVLQTFGKPEVLVHLRGVQFNPTGTQLAAFGGGKAVVWDLSSGREIFSLTKQTSLDHNFAFDGVRIAFGDSDKGVWVVDSKTGKEGRFHTPEKGRSAPRVSKVALSAGGKYLAGAANLEFRNHNDSVIVWETESGRQQAVLDGKTEITSVTFSPDGQRVLAAGKDGTLRVWNFTVGKEIMTIPGHTGEVRQVVYSPDGSFIASAGSDRSLKIWDAQTGEMRVSYPAHSNSLRCVAVSADGNRLATSGDDAWLKVWKTPRPDSFSLTGSPLDVTLDARNDRLVVLNDHREKSQMEIQFIRLSDQQLVRSLSGPRYEVATIHGHSFGSRGKALEISPDGQVAAVLLHALKKQPNQDILASSSEVKLLDTSTGRELRILRVNEQLHCVRFSPDGKMLLGGGGDYHNWEVTAGRMGTIIPTPHPPGTIRIWDVATGKLVRSLEGHKKGVLDLAIDAEGKRLLSSDTDESRLWDLSTGKVVRTFGLPTENKIYSPGIIHGPGLSFSRDGARFTMRTFEGIGKVHDTSTGQELSQLGRDDGISSQIFSHDGKRIFSIRQARPYTGSFSQAIKLWDAENGQEVYTLQERTRTASSSFNGNWPRIFLSADGHHVGAWDGANTVFHWDAARGYQLVKP